MKLEPYLRLFQDSYDSQSPVKSEGIENGGKNEAK